MTCARCGSADHTSPHCPWPVVTLWFAQHQREIELVEDYLAMLSAIVMAACLAAMAWSKDPDFLWPAAVAAVACVVCVVLCIRIWHRQQEQ